IGVRPTFEADGRRVLEVHLLDFEGQIHGRELKTKFLEWIRKEKKCSSGEELVSQLRADEEECLKRKEKYFIKA
ncbi:MAG: riboflavin kinase, partial [Bacteroidota bacterium]